MASRWVVFIILLMACSIQLGCSAPILSKREASEEDTKTTIVSINDWRSKVARWKNIANMNELVWDKELERKASKMTCNRMVTGPDYTVAVIPSEQALAKLGSSYEILLGFCAPTQTKVGCFEFHPPCVGTLGANYAGVCLIGPKNEISHSDSKEGEPGSACPGEKRHDGLCVTQVEQVEEVKEAPKSVEAKMVGADVTPSESNSYFVSIYMAFLCAAIMAYASQ
ncbi:hypothetical protein GCK72_012563 [Caenorhabditis remanei]|uniref:Uncharacterized protein n=1 Tax=Caenorhabditis remanei TaxID=31234 RepID=E3NNB1_CAERE|nr:hypothetical protein GCK72_012563 [Caenorhabditis remanei]EFP10491.1 hypothetical protein CRE_15067 [Caenorhabditis remanei]KAF1756110.1 hypothetical protein GCK72_012563 [Caenorhabditis remanei]